MNQRILVTGGSGLLGSHLLRMLRALGYKQLTSTYQNTARQIPPDLETGIEWKRLALPDLESSYAILEGQDWVIHAAGLISYNKNDKQRLLDINQTGTRNLVNAALTHGTKHFVYVGSIGALGKEKNFVTLNESSPWLQNEFSTTYGLSKYLGELEAWRGWGEGLNVSVVLPSVILGTGDWHRSSLQLIDRVATKSGWYPAGQTGYVDVQDLSRFIIALLQQENSGERWILNAANVPYGVMYKMIGDALGLKKTFRPAPKWLAKLLLSGRSLLTGKSLGLEVLNHAYGTFTYENAKSLTMPGFRYQPVEKTIAEIAKAYKNSWHT